LAERFDVVVIGAGVVGLFAAERLSTRGLSVCILEKNHGPGLGVTSGQANVIHVVQLPFGSTKSRLARKGNAMYDGVCEELGVKILRMPALLVVRGWLRLPVLFFAYLYLAASLRGEYRTQLMRGSSLRELEPSLAEGVTAGVVVDGYGTVDAASLVARLKESLERRGVLFKFRCEVTSAEFREGSMRLKTSTGEVDARSVVNAAGLDSDKVAGILGRNLGSLGRGLGVMAVYSGLSLKTIVAPLPIAVGSRTKGGAIIPATDGTIIIGPTLRLLAEGEATTHTEDDLQALSRKFRPLLRSEGTLVRVYTGVRPLSPTKDFIIDFDQGRRVVNLVGIESPGLTAAPAIAEEVERLVMGARA